MKRKAIAILCTVVLALSAATPLFAGGSKDAASGVKAADPSKPVQPLNLWVYDKGRIDVLTAIGAKFEKKYGIPVKISLVDLGQIKTQFLLASGGAECADLAIIPHDNLGALVQNAAVEPVSLGAKQNQYVKPAIDGFTYNGQLYGVPLSVENIGFFRNTDMVPDAPATWDDVAAIGEKLVKAGKAQMLMGLPDATYNAFPIYSSFGGAIFGKDANGSWDTSKLEIANAGMVKGMEWMTSMVKKGLVPKAIDWDAAHVLFESGKAPFILTGPWALTRFKAAGVHYAISPFPAATKGGKSGAPFLGVQGIIISSASKQKLLAQAFAVEYIATEANMKALSAADGRPSAWKSIFETASDPDTKSFNAAGVNAIPMPSIPEMGYVWDAWVNAAALSFSGEKSPQDALLNAKTQVEQQIKAKK
jgi:arabinogalactan oligomer/maltooligosaccharide transport system substrate-binding protein